MTKIAHMFNPLFNHCGILHSLLQNFKRIL